MGKKSNRVGRPKPQRRDTPVKKKLLLPLSVLSALRDFNVQAATFHADGGLASVAFFPQVQEATAPVSASTMLDEQQSIRNELQEQLLNQLPDHVKASARRIFEESNL